MTLVELPKLKDKCMEGRREAEGKITVGVSLTTRVSLFLKLYRTMGRYVRAPDARHSVSNVVTEIKGTFKNRRNKRLNVGAGIKKCPNRLKNKSVAPCFRRHVAR